MDCQGRDHCSLTSKLETLVRRQQYTTNRKTVHSLLNLDELRVKGDQELLL